MLKKLVSPSSSSSSSSSSFPQHAAGPLLRSRLPSLSPRPSLHPSPSPSIGLLAASVLLFVVLFSAQSAIAGSYESPELSSSELQSGKRMSPYVSYQPWSYMKRAPAAPIIRFGKRSAEWTGGRGPAAAAMRNIRASSLAAGPLIRFGKRSPSSAPLIRFGRRPADSAPLIRFGKRAPMPGGAPLIRFGRSWENRGEWQGIEPEGGEEEEDMY